MIEPYANNSVNSPGATTGNQAISCSFVMYNSRMTDYQYVYNGFVDINDTKHIVDSGHILVKNNQYYVKNERFNLTLASGKQEVEVELTNKQQSTDFWMGE